MALLSCYNRSCSKGGSFKEEENVDESCQHHPGAPIFHEGYKGWSCCKKRTTDFTEFLNIPGCTKGKHNPVKPPEPEKNPPSNDDPVIMEHVPAMMTQKAPDVELERPSNDLPRSDLKTIIADSLKVALEQQKKKKEIESNGNDENNDNIQIGAPCKHNACNATYKGDENSNILCEYHPGGPVFHEGYKFWTCCNKRTSDFDEFLKQSGCQSGRHEWMKPSEVLQKRSTCRYDWHQTGKFTTITIYSKMCDPDNCHVKVNPTSVSAFISFNGGLDTFELVLVLHDVIYPDGSSVEYTKTKAEIKLRKRDAFSWPRLEYKSPE